MSWIASPTTLAGLFTLIILEIVLGIDNLIFVTILANKLAQKQKQLAKIIGLTLALILRIVALYGISHIATLTKPYLYILEQPISGRNIILLIGGVFLIFKATMELHERLEGYHHDSANSSANENGRFWGIVIQVVVIDIVFSIDSIITAVAMVNELSAMIAATIIAIITMIAASNFLEKFINQHPSIIILCLGFLLMLGFSLITEGLNYYVPKGYIYASISFSVLIELFNHYSMFRHRKKLTTKSCLRAKTVEIIDRLLRGGAYLNNNDLVAISGVKTKNIAFNSDERSMISGVLNLAEQRAKSIMTPINKVYSINIDDDADTMKDRLINTSFSKVIVMGGVSNKPIGILEKDVVLSALITNNEVSIAPIITRPAVIATEATAVLNILCDLKNTNTTIAFVTSKSGDFAGIITLADIMTAIVAKNV